MQFLFLFFVFFASSVFSQENYSVPILWSIPENSEIPIQSIDNNSNIEIGFQHSIPNFYWLVKINSSIYSKVSVSKYETINALIDEVEYLNLHSIIVPTTVSSDLKVTKGGQEVFIVLNLFPFIMEEGVIKRITSIDIHLDPIKNPLISKEKSTVSSSVLSCGTGTWFKIGVPNDGIFKMDKAFLEACGINTSGLNPSSINVFGNGDGKLPELNSIARTDDLAKNAIFISGESDGSFDEGDYILFYGFGPSRWSSTNGVVFNQDKNIYSDLSYYFINVNSSDTPLRISSINSSLNPITHSIHSYSFYDTHELDAISLFSGGQRWYGELFDSNLDQTFSFSVSDIDASLPAKFEVSLASNSSEEGTSYVCKVNGTQIGSGYLLSGNYKRTDLSMTLSNPTSSLPLEIILTRNSPSINTYLDKITLNTRRNLILNGTQFNFRDLISVGVGNVGNFSISNFSNSNFVWEVTNRHIPKIVNGQLSGSTFSFQLQIDSLREFVVSDGSNFFIPEKAGNISCQNLHGLEQADYLIVTYPDFIDQAERLAKLHRETGLLVHVVTTDQIYNEFSSGMLDPTAIKSFVKMFYDRSVVISGTALKYVLLFGDATYDPKNRIENNNNFVPTYEALWSEDHTNNFATDDYFGLLNDNESMGPSDLVDVGIGRLLISDLTTAKQQVDKIEHYLKNGSNLFNSGNSNCCNEGVKSSTFGDWRLKTVMIADDEQSGDFIKKDAEPNSNYVHLNNPEINCDKIYLDAFPQISGTGGQRYPEVYDAITDRVEHGALIVNYVGHGGETGVAEERVIRIPQIQDWRNIDNLNLMVTATCEFTKFDDPSRVCAGEWVSLNPYGASIALMTTTRSIIVSINTDVLSNFYKYVYTRDLDNKPLAFGEIIRLTKNGAGAGDNKRCFLLIGDPALRIALPLMRIVTDSINSLSPTIEVDTIKALSKITIKGHVEDYSNTILTDFNGVLSPTVFDKFKTQSTLGQDNLSPIIQFKTQKNALYKGKATVKNGYFEFSFIVPKDINLSYGKGKISYYADNGVFDAFGQDTLLIIGGVDPNGIIDVVGPDIKLYINNKNFAVSGITDETPILIADVFDENGINTVGNGVGHDVLAVLDGNTANPIVLNDYYKANLDTYQSGRIEYNFSKLEKGLHTLSLKVWDVNDNSSQVNIEFIVKEKEELSLDHVLNYPNPFTTSTNFYFEHNQVCTELETQIQIFTVAGKLVKTINELVLTNGFRSEGIYWNGLDEFGDKLAKGVYIYILKVKTLDGKTTEKIEKLVLLN